MELQGVELLQGVEAPDQYSTEATFKVPAPTDQTSDMTSPGSHGGIHRHGHAVCQAGSGLLMLAL